MTCWSAAEVYLRKKLMSTGYAKLVEVSVDETRRVEDGIMLSSAAGRSSKS